MPRKLEKYINDLLVSIKELYQLSDISLNMLDESNAAEKQKQFEQKAFLLKQEQKLNTLLLPVNINDVLVAYLKLCRKENNFSDYEIANLQLLAASLNMNFENQQLINDLRNTNEELLEKDRQKNELISTVSHELKTPMTSIMGYCELILNNKYPEATVLNFIAEIQKAGMRLSNMINNFLDLARIESTGEIKVRNFEENEIDWLAEKAWDHIGSGANGFELELNFEEELPSLVLDAESITRVFINLFSNAIKYSFAKDKKIYCSIKKVNGEIFCSVKDNGKGIPEDKLNSIFEQFSRLEDKDNQYINGSGLGLWIAKKIIEAHKGKIYCKSEIGAGCEFVIKLPLTGIIK